MKNKKLFAILTLVCFMFTLMPVAAFAAQPGQVEVNGEETATVYVNAEFDATVTTGGNYVYYVVDEDGEGVAVSKDGVDMTLSAAGSYEVYAVKYAAETDAAYKIVTDYSLYANEKVDLLKANCKSDIVKGYADVKVKTGKANYAIVVTDTATDNIAVATGADADNGYEFVLNAVKANNGFKADEIEVGLYIANADGSANLDKEVKDAKLSYSTNSGYVTVNAIDAVTDKNGEAKFSVSATKAGNYKVTVKYEKAAVDFLVKVGVSEVAGVTTVVEPKAPVALTSNVAQSGIVFKLVDGNGDVIKAAADRTPFATPAALDVTVIEAPVDAALAEDNVVLSLMWSAKAQGWILAGADSFDEEGKYTFKVALENGAAAQGSVTIKEFGDPVSMTLKYNETTVTLPGAATVEAVKLVDANGVTKDITDESEYTIEYAANGLAVANIDGVGALTTITSAQAQGLNVMGSTITVMAIVDSLDLTATAELKVVNSAVSLKYAKTTADVAVNNTLTVNTVDVNGDKVDITALSSATVNVYVLDAPENAKYAVSGTPGANNNTINVSLTASAAGEYKLQTVVKYNDGTTDRYLSSVDTITVGGTTSTFKDVVVVSLGADSMIVNNKVVKLDVAPFIENNRTMLQFNVLYVFGIDVQWDGVDTITAEGNGTKVVLKLGSKVAVVNGEEVALDVAPYSTNGRTVVPVGFITGTFGINPTFTYNADGSIADILFAK